MVDARVTRLTTEVLADAPNSAGVTRQGIQTALALPGANSAAVASVVRFASEVLAAFPDRVGVTRQGIQSALALPGANSAAIASVVRFAQEILAQTPPQVAVTRQGIQAALALPGVNSAAVMRVARMSFEALARGFIPMTTFSIPANFELFLHNWARLSKLESAYDTIISPAAESLSEERTGLLQKPYRSLTCQWEVKGDVEANTFLVEMRRLVDETSVAPLYGDVAETTQSAVATDTTVFGDFSRGRFFQNGPVAIVRLRRTKAGDVSEIAGVEYKTIATPFDNKLELTAGLDNGFSAGNAIVIPLMQVHPQTELEITLRTNNLIQVTATFDEIYGATALPPTASDLPGGFDSYLNHPILSTVPQWANGVKMRHKREGSQDSLGRGRVVYQRGARHRVIHELLFQEDREGAWDIIRFFDTRRGRLLPFWVIDFENVFDVVGINSSFTSVSPNGDLTDFQDEMEFFGIIFKDGTAAVRQATSIQDVASIWRLTMDSPLPVGKTHTDVECFGRARLCRMRDDALGEEWTTSGVCSLRVPVTELLAEGEVTT